MKKFRICALALLMLLAGTNVFVANRNNEIKKSLDIENVEALGFEEVLYQFVRDVVVGIIGNGIYNSCFGEDEENQNKENVIICDGGSEEYYGSNGITTIWCSPSSTTRNCNTQYFTPYSYTKQSSASSSTTSSSSSFDDYWYWDNKRGGWFNTKTYDFSLSKIPPSIDNQLKK